jgi:hypothetical protein
MASTSRYITNGILPVLALALAAAGCGLFATQTPTPPTQGVQPPPPNFVTPESTLATLERAVEFRQTDNYSRCFTDSVGNNEPGFYSSFDPSDLADWRQNNPDPGIWTLERELQFFPRFLAYNPNAFYEVTFSTFQPDFDLAPDQRVLNRHYRVTAAGSPVAAGAAILIFQQVGLAQEWKIRFWEDLRDTADVRTWGTARLNGR